MNAKDVKKRNTGCLVAILIFLAAVVAVSVIAVLRMGTLGGDDSAKISNEEYDKIQNGMSYKEVSDIVGGEGVLQTETGSKNDLGYKAEFIWNGEKNFGSMVKVIFTDDKMTAKEQYGLK